jgi:hypothetical protein
MRVDVPVGALYAAVPAGYIPVVFSHPLVRPSEVPVSMKTTMRKEGTDVWIWR